MASRWWRPDIGKSIQRVDFDYYDLTKGHAHRSLPWIPDALGWAVLSSGVQVDETIRYRTLWGAESALLVAPVRIDTEEEIADRERISSWLASAY